MKKLLVSTLTFSLACSNSGQSWGLDHYLSSTRVQFSAAVYNDQLYFYGGNTGNGLTDVVDVFDPSINDWGTSTTLSTARAFTSSIGTANALYAAGGVDVLGAPPFSGTSTVDIYVGDTWTTHSLTEAFFSAQAVHVGTKVLFTGGLTSFAPGAYGVSDLVHIYDEMTDTWSTANLSFARANIASASNGTIAVFAGGIFGSGQVSDVVDIYDSSTDTWSTAALSEAKGNMTGAYLNGNFYFAGGVLAGTGNSTDVVEVFNGSTWDFDSHTISLARGGAQAAVAGDIIFFAGGGDMNVGNWSYTSSTDIVDMYNTVTDTWSTSTMNLSKVNHSALGHNDKVYVAGGLDNSIFTLSNALEIWELTTGMDPIDLQYSYHVYPNPVKDYIALGSLDGATDLKGYQILDVSGKLLASSSVLSRSIDVSTLQKGTYLLKVLYTNGESTLKFVKE